ncbi:FAD-binding oxidoreductase [Winogradskyella aurantia]|uniref:Flavodoxin reductase n=1 Tax=Winogradskyella aurantia TaxID=1915063 RepID=A0A265UT40_9FLAO|nr:FAD-binding oxidoreductase [Winogradskyella aurantia]OZV68466.1 flavodoxin reductase [Winogradskyella aurantia]
MEYKLTLEKIEHVNHNVLRLVTNKPKGYSFSPGQATELAIDKDTWRDKKRPFTFTSLPEDDRLEFTIKVYPSHDGVTEQIETLKVGDHLIIGEAWGAIQYHGEGTFIAGGAGVTPFISILKDLRRKAELKGNTLFFANHRKKDIIYKNQLETWLGDDLHVVLSKENLNEYKYGHIDKEILQTYNLDISKPVYLCGPPAMMDAVKTDLYELGLSKDLLVTEAA